MSDFVSSLVTGGAGVGASDPRLATGGGTNVTTTATQTLTNKTLTSPAINTPVIDSGVGVVNEQTKFCTTEFVAVTGTTGATLTNIVGLTAFDLAAAGVYKVEGNIMVTATTNCGIKLGFKYTTATLTSIGLITNLEAAASVVNALFTTATDQASIVANKAAAWLTVRFSGRIVVNAAGTLALQAAQETAHADETKVLVGSSLTLTRIG